MFGRIWPGSLVLLGAILLLAPACATWDGHFEVLGYTTRPNYDCNIRTVYLNVFENRTQYRGVEFDLHQALQRQLHWKTPYRVTSDRGAADTEITGAITSIAKGIV